MGIEVKHTPAVEAVEASPERFYVEGLPWMFTREHDGSLLAFYEGRTYYRSFGPVDIGALYAILGAILGEPEAGDHAPSKEDEATWLVEANAASYKAFGYYDTMYARGYLAAKRGAKS